MMTAANYEKTYYTIPTPKYNATNEHNVSERKFPCIHNLNTKIVSLKCHVFVHYKNSYLLFNEQRKRNTTKVVMIPGTDILPFNTNQNTQCHE